VTECQPKDKICLFGRLNRDLLCSKLDDWCERIVFIFGPPAMVDGMKEITKELGCSEGNIKTEKFIGY
jgi:ferredoxin-NADP reductase